MDMSHQFLHLYKMKENQKSQIEGLCPKVYFWNLENNKKITPLEIEPAARKFGGVMTFSFLKNMRFKK